MPAISTITSSAVLKEIDERIYVDGQRRRDCFCTEIYQTAGIMHGTATIVFPEADYNDDPADEGEIVVIYLNKSKTEKPMFRGYIAHKIDSLVDGVTYMCYDDRGHLNDAAFEDNYNEIDEITGTVHTVTNMQDIIEDAYDQYSDHQSSNGNSDYLAFRFSSFPDNYPGEQLLKGTPHGAGIEQVLQDAGDGEYRIKVEHNVTHSQLEAFAAGSGKKRHIYRGTDPESAPDDQPAGHANVTRLGKDIEYARVVNHIIARGRRRKIETAVQLVEAWDTTNQATYIDDYILDTIQKSDAGDNASYDEAAAYVGRIYTIPQIADTYSEGGDTKGRTRYVKILPDLIQDFWFTDDNGDDIKAAPFIAYKFSGDGSYRYMDTGFSVENDQVVVFEEPLMDIGGAVNDDGDGTYSRTKTEGYATEVWLNFAYESEQTLYYDSNKQGGANVDKVIHVSKDEFIWETRSDNFDVSYASNSITLTKRTVDIDDTKEDTELGAWADRRIAYTQEPPETYQVEMGGMPLSFEVGDRLSDNHDLTDANVIAVKYDLIEKTTTLTASTN